MTMGSKQPKLEPKLVSALSETKHLFRLFRFFTETESFDVSIEPKHTEDQPKQFDKEHCAAKAFYSCPAIISRRPESQNTSTEPQLNPEEKSRIIQARSNVTLEKSSRNYKPSEE